MVGAFHLQGSYWDRQSRRFKTDKFPISLDVTVSPWDVACMHEVIADIPGTWAGAFAALRNGTGEVLLLDGKHGNVPFALQTAEADILTLTPLAEGPAGALFGPLGLALMLNCGGAVKAWRKEHDGFTVGLRGEGQFVAASNNMPEGVELDGHRLERGRGWSFSEGRLQVNVPQVEGPIEHELRVVYS